MECFLNLLDSFQIYAIQLICKVCIISLHLYTLAPIVLSFINFFFADVNSHKATFSV